MDGLAEKTKNSLESTVVFSVLYFRACHLAKKETWTTGSDDSDVRRQYQCAAYNALVAILTCTKTEKADSKFYDVFLFSENKAKVR